MRISFIDELLFAFIRCYRRLVHFFLLFLLLSRGIPIHTSKRHNNSRWQYVAEADASNDAPASGLHLQNQGVLNSYKKLRGSFSEEFRLVKGTFWQFRRFVTLLSTKAASVSFVGINADCSSPPKHCCTPWPGRPG